MQMLHFGKFITEGNEKAEELAEEGAVRSVTRKECKRLREELEVGRFSRLRKKNVGKQRSVTQRGRRLDHMIQSRAPRTLSWQLADKRCGEHELKTWRK